MTDLVKEAIKLGVPHQKNIKLELPGYESSAKKVVEGILGFLKEHNVEDAYWECSARERYGDTEVTCEVSIIVDKTESELKNEIEARRKAVDAYKEQRRKQYEQLKKEFEG